MKKFFFTLLILALFFFEIKTKDYNSSDMIEKIERLIEYLKDNDLWDDLLRLWETYNSDYVVHWCMTYDSYQVCEALIDDYLDKMDDPYDLD